MAFRSYFFNNFYVAGIRTGIQAGHAVDEMWLELVEHLEAGTLDETKQNWLVILKEFAKTDKTFVVLNGGDHQQLQDLIALLTENNDYPWSFATEPGLNDAITSVRVVLPERLYDKVSDRVGRILLKTEQERSPTDLDFVKTAGYSPWEQEFLTRRLKCGLAD